MTAARHRIMSLGYYDGLLEKVCEKAAEFAPRFVVDCGSGEGRFAYALAEAFPEADVAGTDLARAAVNVASKTVREAVFAVANSNALPYADGRGTCTVSRKSSTKSLTSTRNPRTFRKDLPLRKS